MNDEGLSALLQVGGMLVTMLGWVPWLRAGGAR
jgi:hypothetical protein